MSTTAPTPTKPAGSSSDQDNWLRSTLGIHPASYSTPAGAADGAGQWPSNSLGPAGSDQQSQEFRTALDQQITAIDGHLAYTSEHAEPVKHQPMAVRRESIVDAYQPTVAQIDPADPTKAKGAIDKVLADARALAAEVAQFRQAVEKAYNDWQSWQPKYDEAATQIAEMQAWGHDKAPAMQSLLDGVHTQLDGRAYAEACTAFDQFLPQLKPVYEDYQKQKVAQAEYEPARKEIDPRLAKAATCEFKKLEPMQQALQPAQADMDKDAEAKDYVDALTKEKALAAKLDEYENALAELEAKKKAFDAAKADVQPKLDAAKQVDHPKLAPMQQDLEASRAQMDQAEQDEDFDKGLSTANDLSSKADTFDAAVKELEQQKKEYEGALAPLQPRLDTAAQCPFKSLGAMKDELVKRAATMKDATATEDYVTALQDATDLSGRMDEFEKSVKETEEKKKAYDDARQALDPKLQAVGQATPHKSLEADKKAIDGAVPLMEKAAGDEDFAAAQTSAQDLTEKAEKYAADAQAIDDKKKQFDEAWAKVQPLIDDMKSTRNDDLAPMQQTILKSVDDIQKQAADEDYDGALTATDALSRMFSEYLNADASKICSVTWHNNTYYGTEKELVALKLRLVKRGIDQVFPHVQNHAEAIEGQYNDLKALNDKQYIVAWFVTGLGGAHLENVASGIAAHKQAIAAMHGATEAQQAQDAYKGACEAVSASGKALSEYMSAIDMAGTAIIYTLQAVEVICFSVAAALAAPVILPEGAGILASMAANGIAGTTFGALEATAQQAAPLTQGEDVDWQKAKVEIGKAALLNGVGGLLGGAMGGKLKEDVGEIVIKKLAIDNPEVKKRVLGAIESSMAALIQAAIANRPDLGSGKMTVGEFALVLAENAIAGGLGGAIAPGMQKIRPSGIP